MRTEAAALTSRAVWAACLLAAGVLAAVRPVCAGAPKSERVNVPYSHPKGQVWSYTTTTPPAGWEKPDFTDAAWKKGEGAFGSPGMPNTTVRTTWATPDIWLRRTFVLEGTPAGNTQVLIYYDEDAEVYVNGILAAQTKSHVGDYVTLPMSPAGKAALIIGRNVLAVHCKQTAGGQCIDVGLGAKLGLRSLAGEDLKTAAFSDWLLQDAADAAPVFTGEADAGLEKAMLEKVLQELGPDASGALRSELDQLAAGKVAGADPKWRALYLKACEARRALRLKPLLAKWQRFAFAKHWNVGGSHYAYTECQSDAQAERNWIPGSALCILEQNGLYGEVQTLIDDPKGVIRNPDVSYDGKRILFAWKKDDRKDDYHLYDYDVAAKQSRQLTTGLGFADYEGCYLPTGDIVFSSSRCVQTVDCWWTEVSNLYACNKDGQYIRRLGFDQVHTNFPSTTDDGRVLYTRWDYNDRGQLFPQQLFQMFNDGTAQTACYGNNCWFPTTMIHARQIPGTQKIICIATGHHSDQSGKLLLVDPAKGRQENEGTQLIAPVRPTPAERIDAYGQNGDQFQYPYALDETHYLVTYSPRESGRSGLKGFGLYFMDIDGKRELLAWDPKISCNQAVPLAARPKGHIRPSSVDYHKNTGTYYLRDVYFGPGLKGIPRGAAKALRVVALEFRAAGIGSNGNGGPAGGALVSTPVSINNGTWDVKRILGTVPIEEDGSAYFTVPAQTPVYFQVLDEKGYTIQSMRTWSTLQPGEGFACVGCHETKNGAPPTYTSSTSKALQKPPQALQPFYGPPRGFSFAKEIQPILDRKCITCHDDRSKVPTDKKAAAGTGAPAVAAAQSAGKIDPKLKSFSLLGEPNEDRGSKRKWSDAYLALTQRGRPNRIVNWLNVQSIPPMLPPYFAGAVKSDLLAIFEKGHYDVKLTREETDKVAAWIDLLVPYCGDYREANTWSPPEVEKYERYLKKRQTEEELEHRHTEELLSGRQTSAK